LLKASNTDIAIGKYSIGQTPIFKKKKSSYLEDTEYGPEITTLLPLNHRIDFRDDSDYKLIACYRQVWPNYFSS